MSSISSIRVPREKLSRRVIESLRAQLIAGEIPRGAKLPTETRLSEAFGVSRTVVREAIAALAADGLVEARQGAGVFAIDNPAASMGALAVEMGGRVSTALSVLEVRLPIEVEAAGLAAARRSPSQEAVILEAFFEFELLLREGEPTGGADLLFHRAIASATGNPFYVELLNALGQHVIPCDVRSPFSTELVQDSTYQARLQEEHLAILTAISASEVEGAREAMRLHLGNSQQRYRARLTERQAHYAATAGH